MTRLTLLPALLLLALVAGCAEDDSPTAVRADNRKPDSYVISVSADAKSVPETWRLTCNPADGDHPEPKAACAAIEKATDPFAPTKPDMACTEIYGGPAIATIRGERDGVQVDTSYSRVNGCEIARWDALGPVLPSPPTVKPS